MDRLLERAGRCVTVLDVSRSALARARARLGDAQQRVKWIEADVTSEWHVEPVNVWHDRAVFHFLTDADERARYMDRLRATVRGGGTVILATFAPDAAKKCSGLPVQRYDATALRAELGAGFALVETQREEHRTPGGAVQSFCYAAFRRDHP